MHPGSKNSATLNGSLVRPNRKKKEKKGGEKKREESVAEATSLKVTTNRRHAQVCFLSKCQANV